MTPIVYLASASPRRAELLRAAAIPFQLLAAPGVDESVLAQEDPQDYVERLARSKAEAGWQQLSAAQRADAVVLGADTSVVLGGRILGKPRDAAEAASMLHDLSGREHRVLTAVCVVTSRSCLCACSDSSVRFAELDDALIRAYVDSGEPLDKAGSYAIQGRGAVLVTALAGSYSGVVGLPLRETAQLLQQAGVAVWS